MKATLRKGLLAAATAGAMVVGAESALALTSVSSNLFHNQLNLLSDNNAEYLLKSDGAGGFTDPVKGSADDHTVDVGDRLRAILRFETTEDLTGGGGTNDLGDASNNEFAGISDIIVTGKVCGVGGCSFTFAPYAGFAAELAGMANVPYTAAELAGTMVAIWEDTTPDFSRTSCTIAACEATATDGVFRWALGHDGSDGDELWTATTVTDDISVVGAIGPPTPGGAANVQLSFIQNDLFSDWSQVVAGVAIVDGLIDVNATLSILGTGGADTPFDAFSNIDATIRPIPEPGMLGLMGLGLIGVAAAYRRSRKA